MILFDFLLLCFLTVTSDFMEVIIHNKVSKHNNTLVLYFVVKDKVVLKQVYAVTSCAKAADAWGSNFGEYAAVK